MVVDSGRCVCHAAADCGRNDVARGEVLLRVDALHHALAGGVEEDRALAAHGLTDERLLPLRLGAAPQNGRVELDELEICDRYARADGERDAVAGDGRRVRRGCVHLAVTTGGNDDGARHDGADALDTTVLVEQRHVDARDGALALLVGADDEVQPERMLDDANSGEAH